LRLATLKTYSSGNTRSYLDYSYQLDDASNITHIEDHRALTGQAEAAARQNTQSFLYDDLYRLLQAAWPSARSGQPGQIDYRYDRIGNMLNQISDLPHMEKGKPVANLGQMTSGASLGAWGRGGRGSSIAGPHALTTVTPTGGGSPRSYSYDKKGSMTEIDGLTCRYDFKDRITSAENDQMRASYLYDHTDRRVRKTVIPKSSPTTLNTQLSSTTTYINRYFELRDADSPVKYVWQGNTRLARAYGTLASGIQPLQWIRLHAGWNLVSLSASAASRSQLLSDSHLSAIAYWDTPTTSWKSLTAAATPPDAFVAWIYATSPTVLSLRGPPYSLPTTIPSQPQFLPMLNRETLDLGTSFPATTELWSWNSAFSRWNVRPADTVPAALFANSSPSKAAPNTALYLATTAGGNLALNLPPPAFSLRYYHGDHLGTTNVTTDSTGELVEESTSYPFGHPRSEYQPHDTNEPYGFTQKELDEESGLHYFEARYLVATVGRFNRADPLCLLSASSSMLYTAPQVGKLMTLIAYDYCNNSPLNLTDESGLEPVKNQVGTIEGFIKTMDSSRTKIGVATGEAASKNLARLGETRWTFKGPLPVTTPPFNNIENRYVYTKDGGWIDMVHFAYYAGRGHQYQLDGSQDPVSSALKDGNQQEWFDRKHSSYSYEDLPSDKFGADFGANYFDPKSSKTLSQQIGRYFNEKLHPTDSRHAPNFNSLPAKDDGKSAPTFTNKSSAPMFTKP
jgi:RHS repeat-associated protein